MLIDLLQFPLEQITQRDLLEEVLGSVPAEEIPDSVELARVRQKEHEQKRLEMERRRKNEQNEKLRLEQELELKRLLKVSEQYFLIGFRLKLFTT